MNRFYENSLRKYMNEIVEQRNRIRCLEKQLKEEKSYPVKMNYITFLLFAVLSVWKLFDLIRYLWQ